MRTLKKNQRKLYYAPFMGTEPIIDEYGNETLESNPSYDELRELEVNYSPNNGQMNTQLFGNITDYSRVLAFVGSCPLKEKDMVLIGETKYEVVKVADGLDTILVAIGEII
jgi:hypothetical protein